MTTSSIDDATLYGWVPPKQETDREARNRIAAESAELHAQIDILWAVVNATITEDNAEDAADYPNAGRYLIADLQQARQARREAVLNLQRAISEGRIEARP